MSTAFAVGTGISLRSISEPQRMALQRAPTLAFGDFWKWADAWTPTMYAFVDSVGVIDEAPSVLQRWPEVEPLCIYTWAECDLVPPGWRWIRRSPWQHVARGYCVRLGTEEPNIPQTEGPTWAAVQYLAWRGYDRIVVLGSEHTDVGYVHDPTKKHCHRLEVSRREGEILCAALREHGIEVLDASGPTSTLTIPRVTLEEVL